MAAVTPARRDVQIEEVQYRSSVSESTFFKMGGSVNFINARQFDTHAFLLNGPYQSALPGAGSGPDGVYVFQFDIELVGISVFNLVSGSSGTTTVDVHRIEGSGNDTGSIFTVKPSINSTASNNAYGSTNYAEGTSQGGTGITLPTVNTTEFNQFDAIRLDIDSVMQDPENFGLLIHFRPR